MALEAYHLAQSTFSVMRDKLKMRTISVAPLRMHALTTESVPHLVLTWLRDTAKPIETLLQQESRLARLRYRLLCAVLNIRAKVATLAMKLSVPVGTSEGSVLRSKKSKYEDLLLRAAALRAKVDSTKKALYGNFVPRDPAATLRLVEALEADVTVFFRVVGVIENDQFALSVELTRLRLRGDAGDAPSSAAMGAALSHTVKQNEEKSERLKVAQARRLAAITAPDDPVVEGRGSAPRSTSTTLDDSRALMQELRAASEPPLGSTDLLRVRSDLRDPLSHEVPTDGHRKMVDGTVGSVRPKHTLSRVLELRRKEEERKARQPRRGSEREAPPRTVAFNATVIPFRQANAQQTPLEVPNRVRIADHVMKDIGASA